MTPHSSAEADPTEPDEALRLLGLLDPSEAARWDIWRPANHAWQVG